MRNLKRTLITSIAMILVCIISVAATTFAYLHNASEIVENTFTIGKIKLSLDEAKVNIHGKPVDYSGQEVDLDEAPRVLENEYKLMPGRTYVKDPTVHVSDDSEPCYLFALVFIPDAINDVIKYDTNLTDEEDIGYQIVQNGWKSNGTRRGTGMDGSEGYYMWFEYWGGEPYPAKVSKGADLPFFQSITVKEGVTYDQLKKANACTMEITAYAFQFEETDTVRWGDIFNTFETVFDPYNLRASSN